jgi:carboxylate-amine ligase
LRPAPAAERLLSRAGEGIKPEIFQSMIEVSTGVCDNLTEVEADLRRALSDVRDLAADSNLRVLGSGTHPAARFDEHLLADHPRYHYLLERTQWVARRSPILGLHVHVGASSGDHAILLMNELSPYLAPLLALSASSPFMDGMDTGLASSRITVYESHPACGTPPSFATWKDFDEHCARLRRARAIGSLKDLWWDIRPSPRYGTVELRICDGQSRLGDTLAIVAAVQCLVAWLESTRPAHAPARPPSEWRLRENKWRAARYGLEAELVVNEAGQTRSVRSIWSGILHLLEPHAERLGCSRHLLRIAHILEAGASYQRQRSLFQARGSLRRVVESLADEWHASF